MRVKVTGTEQLTRVSKVVSEKGNSTALKRRMTKAFKKAADPITRDQVKNLGEKLPHGGGAAAEIGGETRTTVRTSFARATVTISDSWPGHDIKAIDKGILRHPTFQRVTPAGVVGAGRGEWFVTAVTPFLLTDPFLEHRELVRAELGKEMDRLAREIAAET